jgi:hypothetical protein
MCSMGLWKTHSVIGTKASGLLLTKPVRSCQHDLPTTLHTLHDRARMGTPLPCSGHFTYFMVGSWPVPPVQASLGIRFSTGGKGGNGTWGSV